MVSTNSITSSFAAFVINGNEPQTAEPSEDFSAIATEVLNRLAPALPYVIRTPLHELIKNVSYFGVTTGGEFAKRLKAIVLCREMKDEKIAAYYVLASDGKFYSLLTTVRTLEREEIFSCHAVTGDIVFEGMAKCHNDPLEVFLDKLYSEFEDSIKQAEERLSNMKGRGMWLAEVVNRYDSTLDKSRT